MQDLLAHTPVRQKVTRLFANPRMLWSAATLVAVFMVIAVVMITGYALLGFDERPTNTSDELGPTELNPIDEELSGIPGDPGTLGWEWIEGKKSNGLISVSVHHVIASHFGIYAVYSMKVEDEYDRLGTEIITKHILDGVIASGPAADRLIDTDGKTSVRIASLGKPVASVATHGMSITVTTSKGRSSLSIDFVRDKTPGVIEGGISIMRHPDPDIAYLMHSEYGDVTAPSTGTTFGVHPGRVTITESAPAYFMISPDGAMRQISVTELKSFNEKHTISIDEKRTE